jgi:hypothetical protein
MKYHLGAGNALNQEAVTNPLSQYHLGAGYALNWCEAAHYIGCESALG